MKKLLKSVRNAIYSIHLESGTHSDTPIFDQLEHDWVRKYHSSPISA